MMMYSSEHLSLKMVNFKLEQVQKRATGLIKEVESLTKIFWFVEPTKIKAKGKNTIIPSFPPCL